MGWGETPIATVTHEALAVKQVQHTWKHAVSAYTHAHIILAYK